MAGKTPLCILSPPGGPAGPFWGAMLQNGRVLATQIIAREDANLLCVIHNALVGDPDTLERITDQARNTQGDTKAIIKAIWEVACDESV